MARICDSSSDITLKEPNHHDLPRMVGESRTKGEKAPAQTGGRQPNPGRDFL
jgi:hypothetical protein